jgi:Uma2 family endonuclease
LKAIVVLRRFTRDEYYRMAETGILRPDEKVELLDGEIVVMSPQRSRSATVLLVMTEALREAFGRQRTVRTQLPLAVSETSEPEPDIAVVQGTPDDYLEGHPTTALLVVEVSDTTLAKDRRKARLYAEAKVPDYWIANLVDGVLEVHRDPKLGDDGEWDYAEVNVVKPTASVRPLRAPKAKLKVSELLR